MTDIHLDKRKVQTQETRIPIGSAVSTVGHSCTLFPVPCALH